MQIIDEVRENGGVMNAFYSYCGGLVAPESNDNPWGYKFSWNPRNVILAGQGTAQFIANGKYKYLPYQHLFNQSKTISIEGHGTFDAYANRDSLSYRAVYGLESIPTMLRGTLRAEGFCKAWDVFVKLGITDDSWKLKNADDLTYADFIETFLPTGTGSIKQRLAAFVGVEESSISMSMIEWTGILKADKIPLQEASPAQILQELLERKWKLQAGDKDMVVMQHIFEYSMNGKSHTHTSSLVVKGDDEIHTAMAKTVGLPAAIAVKMVLTGTFSGSGVVVPVNKELYQPILKELQSHGIVFTEVVR
jgi:saccharopine dehydrogenase (NADP+, L-glutamate forming)